MKRIWKFALVIAGALGWTGIVADMVTTIEILRSITLTQFAIAFQSVFTIALVWWIWRDIENPPIIFGGYRLRRLAPLVLELLRTKELASSKDTSVGITHLSLASELTRKLDQLRIEHPDLHTTHRFGDPMDDEYMKFTLVLLFLDVLRRNCLAGDLKGARAIMSRMNGNGADNARYPL